MNNTSDTGSSEIKEIPLLDRELFFGNPQVADGQLSPDGKFISFMKPFRKGHRWRREHQFVCG